MNKPPPGVSPREPFAHLFQHAEISTLDRAQSQEKEV